MRNLPAQKPAQRHTSQFDRSFSPRSVAVVGASSNPAKIGSQILNNIITGGFEGKIYPVNLKTKKIQGLEVYRSVVDIGGDVDQVIIAVPAAVVPQVISDCAKKSVPGVTIISSGFKESGPEGAALEKQVQEIAVAAGISVIGPNCLGFINNDINLNATFSAVHPQKGNLIMFSQSGAFGTAVLDWASKVNLGFKYFVSLGNKTIVNESTLLSNWGPQLVENNENIIISGYLEDIVHGRTFMKLCSALAHKHPIVLLKSGGTERSQEAISSHTGSLATDDSIIDTAFQQSGCIRVRGIQELFDTLQLLARQSIPRGNRIAIVTNAGGPGIIATQRIEESNLAFADIDESTKQRLKQFLPESASLNNPIDILGDATAVTYEKTIETTLLDENVDAVIAILTPQTSTQVEKTASTIIEKNRKYPFKPLISLKVLPQLFPGV